MGFGGQMQFQLCIGEGAPYPLPDRVIRQEIGHPIHFPPAHLYDKNFWASKHISH